MVMSTERFGRVEPRLVERACGGWLAVSEPGAFLRVGVEGRTADEARERFRLEVLAWAALWDDTRGGQ